MRPDVHAIPPSGRRQRIAVIGAGIAGNTAAWALSRSHDVTLYEAQDRFGGHAHTVDVDLGGVPTPVDTGFIVYNLINYPTLIKLFETLGVATEWSNMSFGVSLDGGRFEYRSEARPMALFARRRNALSPRFWRMLLDIKRFYGQGPALAETLDLSTLTVGDLLARLEVSDGFADDHLIPMAACIWSASTQQILEFPAATFVRFFINHGLFQLKDRPQWRTVSGGSRAYVTALLADFRGTAIKAAGVTAVERVEGGVRVHAAGRAPELYDQAVLACHGDEALKLIAQPTPAEQRVLGAFRYSSNRAVLHTDASLMPKRKAAWSSWNYVAPSTLGSTAEVPITYWMNSLQNLDPRHDVFVSLNPVMPIRPDRIVREMSYDHPIFDGAAIAAQARKAEVQGVDRLWFAGSYWGYGFHEDACSSGMSVARGLGALPDWEQPAPAPAMAAE
jgi:predicted NAD/FAD-binding protein